MRSDHDALARLDGRGDLFVPVRQHAGHGVFQALGQRDLIDWQVGVTQVLALAHRVVGVQGRRRGVIATTPHQHLLVAVLLGGLGLVQALQATVVALVEAPALDHRQPDAVHLVEAVVQGVDGTLEHRGVGDVELVALGLEQLTCRHGLRHAGGRQIDVNPAGEAVFEVPGGFAVANQDEFVHDVRSHRGESGPVETSRATSDFIIPRPVAS